MISWIRTYLVCAAVLVTAPAQAQQQKSSSMHETMSKNMSEMQSMPMTGDVDKDFAMMMKKHHEDGVKMAQIQLSKGKDAKMQEMARKIMDAQKKEIAEFDEWLKARK